MKIKKYLIGIGVALILVSSNVYADNYFLIVKAVGKITDDIATLKSKVSINQNNITQNLHTSYKNKKGIAILRAKYKIVEEKLNGINKELVSIQSQLKKIKSTKNNMDKHDIKLIKDYIYNKK